MNAQARKFGHHEIFEEIDKKDEYNEENISLPVEIEKQYIEGTIPPEPEIKNDKDLEWNTDIVNINNSIENLSRDI
jgi:hypothetical protein